MNLSPPMSDEAPVALAVFALVLALTLASVTPALDAAAPEPSTHLATPGPFEVPYAPSDDIWRYRN